MEMRRAFNRGHSAAVIASIISLATSAALADTVFEDTFAYASSADLINPAVGNWVPFHANPSITTDYVVTASASGYTNAATLPPTQPGHTLVSGNNRGAYHDLGQTLSDNWTVSASMLINNYSRAATIGLMDANGNNGYGFALNTSNPNNFSGKGFVTVRKIDAWNLAAVTTTQGTQLGANAAGVSYPLGFALPPAPAGGYTTTSGIAFAADAPFIGFTTFDLSYAAGVLTLKQDGTTIRTVTDSSFSSFSRLYFVGGSTLYVDNVTVAKDVVNTSASWNVDADGAWETASNWTGNVVPSVAGANASFGTVITAPRVVTLNAPTVIGGLDFGSASSYTIAGTSALSLDATTGAAVVNVGAGAHTISAPVTLVDDLAITALGGTTINFAGDFNSNGKNISKNGGGVAQFKNIRAADLNASVGIIRIAAGVTPNLPESTSVLTSLAVGGTGKLDLNNNSLILDYAGASPVENIRQQLALAFAGGTWAGASGIGSSSAAIAAADPFITKKTGIGYGEASSLVLTSLGGQTFTGDAVLFRYAVYGDANLDGTIGFPDLVRLAQNYSGANKTWAEGDFNYDGIVDFPDLVSLAQNYGLSLDTVDGASPEFAADWALAQSLIPEPVSVSILLPAAGLFARRRR
jgi:hypothetical protein